MSNARRFEGLQKTTTTTTTKRKIQKGNPYVTECRLSKNDMWCAADNHNDTYHTCAKGFLDLNFNQAVINKISNFREIAQNFTFLQKS